jgi:hypothetical protein
MDFHQHTTWTTCFETYGIISLSVLKFAFIQCCCSDNGWMFKYLLYPFLLVPVEFLRNKRNQYTKYMKIHQLSEQQHCIKANLRMGLKMRPQVLKDVVHISLIMICRKLVVYWQIHVILSITHNIMLVYELTHSNGLFWTLHWIFGFHERCRISRVAEKLLASWEQFYTM